MRLLISLATPQHLDAAFFLSIERWDFRERIAQCSGFLQDGSGNSGAHGVVLDVGLRQLTLYYHFLQQLGVFLHLDSQVLTSLNI